MLITIRLQNGLHNHTINIKLVLLLLNDIIVDDVIDYRWLWLTHLNHIFFFLINQKHQILDFLFQLFDLGITHGKSLLKSSIFKHECSRWWIRARIDLAISFSLFVTLNIWLTFDWSWHSFEVFCHIHQALGPFRLLKSKISIFELFNEFNYFNSLIDCFVVVLKFMLIKAWSWGTGLDKGITEILASNQCVSIKKSSESMSVLIL